MTKTITALFDNYDDAIAAMHELERLGVPAQDVSVVSNRTGRVGETKTFEGETRGAHAAKDAGAGAEIGGVIGGIGGLLAGLGALVIPGIGPVLAAGWLASTITGAAAGAVVGGVAGGLVGALTKAGVPEDEANVYAEGVRRGGTLVTARVDDALETQARAVLTQRSADIGERGRTFQQEGWSRFDPDGRPYATDLNRPGVDETPRL